MTIRTTSTKEELRRKLPGYENRDIICSERRENGHNKTLTYVYTIRGYRDELLFVANFWVTTYNGIGSSCTTFNTLQEAVEFYANIT
jgi:hypothetical protein